MKNIATQLLNKGMIGAALVCALNGRGQETAPHAGPQPNVFDVVSPAMVNDQTQEQIAELFKRGAYAEAEALLAGAVRQKPDSATHYYNLGCAQARQNKLEAALDSLEAAVARGWLSAKAFDSDPDLSSLRGQQRLLALQTTIRRQVTAAAARAAAAVVPAPIATNGTVVVGVSNTVWDASLGVFRSFFAEHTNAAPASVGPPPQRDAAQEWFEAGTAAGLNGIFYDNRDGAHSPLAKGVFPQITYIVYGDEARKRGLGYAKQTAFIFNRPVLGNASVAVMGPFWRSVPREAMVDPHSMAVQYAQYVSNHMYFYVEHNDYDPERGDLYPAHSPYVVVSQGSSGSDMPFLHNWARALACFPPATRAHLERHGLLMPTLQMIFRLSNKRVETPEDYLTGKAHPPVFQAGEMNPARMQELAHTLRSNEVPALIQLRVLEEEMGKPGVDFFTGATEKLFDTPAAIARVFRGVAFERRLVVSAANSRDINGRPLTFRWVVLRGDADAIRIRPRNAAGTSAELVVPYHARRPIEPGSTMTSSRVDIGVFAHNGVHYSAPGFITFYFPANETRVYDDQKRIVSIDYRGGDYTDPLIVARPDWRDEYRYDAKGRLEGWTRTRGETREEFTPAPFRAQHPERDADGK